MSYQMIAFYIFTKIDDPRGLIKDFKTFFDGRDITSRIYISEEGINAQMCAANQDSKDFIVWLTRDARFKDIHFKLDPVDEQMFPHVIVRYRKQLVALDMHVDVNETAYHMSPEEWAEQLDKRDDNLLLLDVRNAYEGKVGHFEGAHVPPLETFREFPKYVEEKLKKEYDPKKTKVMMCCTGGIRCELFSVVMKKAGYEDVSQLDGGIINYGHKVGSKHWKGKLFVFDDRMAVPISDDKEPEQIGECHTCGGATDIFYNCAYMECNELFLSCSACAKERRGCCSETCKGMGDKVRPFVPMAKQPKPFRRLSQLQGQGQSCAVSQSTLKCASASHQALRSNQA